MAEDKGQNAWNTDQADSNNDPLNQPKNVDNIQKTDPRGNQKTAAAPHAALSPADDKKSSGKDIGLVNAPTVSLSPTSASSTAPEEDEPEYKIIDDVKLNEGDKFKYPFSELDTGQGMFIETPKGGTTDKLMDQMHDQVNKFREMGAECEKDENGDDVWESIVIQTKKRTSEGLIQLDGLGKPIVGANQTNRPKLIYSSNFIVRPVVKDDEIGEGTKAEADGVIVIRVF